MDDKHIFELTDTLDIQTVKLSDPQCPTHNYSVTPHT